MKSLAAQLLYVFLSTTALADPHLVARVSFGSDDGMIVSTIVIEIVGDDEQPIPDARILVAESSAADPSGGSIAISAIRGQKETFLPAPKKVAAPDFDGDGWSKVINVFPAEPLDGDSSYRITLRPAGNVPALTYSASGTRYTLSDPFPLEAGKGDPIDSGFLYKSEQLRSNVEVGGGNDGSLFSLRFRYGKSLTDNHRLVRLFANLEADLSPNWDDSRSLIYGPVLSDVNGLWQAPFLPGLKV